MDMVWGFRAALSDNGQMYERKVFVPNYKLYLLSSGFRYGHDGRVVEYRVFGLCVGCDDFPKFGRTATFFWFVLCLRASVVGLIQFITKFGRLTVLEYIRWQSSNRSFHSQMSCEMSSRPALSLPTSRLCSIGNVVGRRRLIVTFILSRPRWGQRN